MNTIVTVVVVVTVMAGEERKNMLQNVNVDVNFFFFLCMSDCEHSQIPKMQCEIEERRF